MKHCMYCNTLMAKDAVFCPKCGKQQVNEDNNNFDTSNINSTKNDQSIFSRIWVDYWKRYFHGHGFSTRSQYWGIVLINFIIFIGCYLLHFFMPFITMNSVTLTDNFIYLYNLPIDLLIVYDLASIIPSISLNCRRLRDAGLSNGEVITLTICDLIPFIDFISAIINLVCVCLPTSKNRRR